MTNPDQAEGAVSRRYIYNGEVRAAIEVVAFAGTSYEVSTTFGVYAI